MGGGGVASEPEEGEEATEDAGDKETPTPVTGKAAAGTGDTKPSIQVVEHPHGGGAIGVAFTDPTDWGTSDDGTSLSKKDITLWLFHLKDSAGTKTKEDIIKDVGTNAVQTPKFAIETAETLGTGTSGVIQLRGDSPYSFSGALFTQYAFFVRIIHPDSTIANKATPKANEGAQYSRDTVVVRGTSGGP